MGFSLFPKNDIFFDLFDKSASNIREAGHLFLAMVQNYTDIEAKAEHLKEIESKGDAITHEIIERLNSSFITPIDREDIYALAGDLDTVLDEIEGAGNRMVLFGVDKPTLECIELVTIVAEAGDLIEKAIKNIRHFKGLQEFIIQIHTLENKADRISRAVTAKLFHECGSTPKDAIELLKWKEIYARLEHTTDRMEDVANVIEDIVMKHA
jgi:predicted phosphate transport protein (TIGR00153 family)